MPISVRRALTADVPLLVEMMAEFYAEGGYVLSQKEGAQTFVALLGNEVYGTIWIAEGDESRLIGYVVLTVYFSMEHGGLSGSIDDLFVRPAHRRRGVAQALLEIVLTDCHARELMAVQVETGRDNYAAQALYERNELTLRGDERLTFVVHLRES